MLFLSSAHFLMPAVLGALLGFSGGLFGIGGGIIAIPVLTTFFAMDQKLAQGTALVMMLPNLVIALWRYHQRHPFPRGRTLALMACAVVATAMTARWASQIDSLWLRRCFGLFLLWLSLYIFWSNGTHHDPQQRREIQINQRWLPLVGLWGGACSGLLSIGGGLVATPVFVRLFGLRQVAAQGFSLALVTPSTGIALATFSQVGLVDWPQGIALALGGCLLVSPGVRLAHRLPEKKLRFGFGCMLLPTALWIVAGG